MIEEWLSQAMHIAMVVFGFGFLIFVHEFGHFIVAKWKGVKVTKFSLGFGPAIFTFRMGETQYALSIIPLGGFCKLAGERLQGKDEQAEQEDADVPPERLLTSKTVGQRALIFAAGAFLNLAVAFPLGVLMVMIGGPAPIAKVSVAPGGAYTAGVHSGDVIKSINNQPVHYWSEMVAAVKKAPIKDPFPVTVDRDGAVKTYQVVRADESDDLGLQLQAETVIGFVHPAGPARKAGIKLGDELISVAKLDEPAVQIKRWQDFEDVIRSSPNAQVTITVKRKKSDRNGGPMTTEIAVTPDKETDYEIGVEYGNGADAVIHSVQGDSPASRAGLQPGDVITAINGKGTTTWSDITSAVNQAGFAIPISLLRDGRKIDLNHGSKRRLTRATGRIDSGRYYSKNRE